MRRKRGSAFTMIEMRVVIAIIMAVMAMALPNFIEMMCGRKWSAAVGSVQITVARARAFATTSHSDASVEFDITPDNGTRLWVESEDTFIESLTGDPTPTATASWVSATNAICYSRGWPTTSRRGRTSSC